VVSMMTVFIVAVLVLVVSARLVVVTVTTMTATTRAFFSLPVLSAVSRRGMVRSSFFVLNKNKKDCQLTSRVLLFFD
jgi:hypothetical protein